MVSRNAWLFQSNPTLYDLRGALRCLREQVWSVSRYANQIGTGDRVYLWEAGREGGVAAVAEISEPPRLLPEPSAQLPFARVAAAFAGDRARARLRILTVIEPVIPRRSIVSNPDLQELGVLRFPRGTNYRLSLDQWQALNSLVQDRVAD
ncbi:MAG TPA: EVE domain-containing protein [Acidobacteriaceae bacterium]